CTSVKKTALSLSMKACVSAVNLVTWRVLTAHLNTAKKKVT
ncbi:4Fe-4S binding domain protein, partial [Vibrio parahaemolyticus EKP-021]